jgi:hypothetical protein
MHLTNKGWVVATLASALACGCASQKNGAARTSSFGELRQQELAEERREFIQEHREQLEELDTQISRLQARLEHEAKFVEADEKAEWGQELFELRQRHGKARAELTRAENASPEEWAAMRGDIGYAIDSLQAGVTKAGAEIGQLFSSGESEEKNGVQRVDLCSVRVDQTSAVISEEGDHIVVQMLTRDQDELDELRERAEALARRDAKSAAEQPARERSRQTPTDASDSSAQADLIKDVTVENIASGVRVVFAPEPGQRTALKRELARDVERIQDESC